MNIESADTALGRFLYYETKQPERIYLHQPDGDGDWIELSWRDVGDKARRIAAYLHSLQLKPGSRIGILAENSVYWCIVDLAIMMAGHVSVPMFTTMNRESVAYLIDHSEMALLFVGPTKNWSEVDSLISGGINCVSLPNGPLENSTLKLQDIFANYPPQEDINSQDGNSLMSIVYTSGTTGVPKGVTIKANSYYRSSKGYADNLQANLNSRFFSYLPLSHIAERVLVWGQSLFCGGTIYFNESLDTFQKDMHAAKPTIFFGVPRIYENFQTWAKEKFGWQEIEARLNDSTQVEIASRDVREFLGLDGIECALVGAAPITEEVHLWYQKIGLSLCELWGQSEILPATVSLPAERKCGSVGKAIPGCELRISPEGEVLARAEFMTEGYWKNPEETNKTIVDGWLHTGDRGELDEEGFLYLKGRIKETFKTVKGKYVAPVPVEEKFSSPLLDQLCLLGSGRVQPQLLVILSEEAKRQDSNDVISGLERLLEEVNTSLENHERVATIVICDNPWTINNGLLTPSMKLKRFAIESHYRDLMLGAEQAGNKVYWESAE